MHDSPTPPGCKEILGRHLKGIVLRCNGSSTRRFVHVAAASSAGALLLCVLACGGVADSAVSSSVEPAATIDPPSDPEPVAEADPAAADPDPPQAVPAPEFEPLTVQAKGVSAALLQLAGRSIETGRTATQLAAGSAGRMQAGQCIYPSEPATVLSVLADAVQVSFDDTDVVAFVIGVDVSTFQVGRQYEIGLVDVIETRPYTTLLGGGNNAFVIDAVVDVEWARAVAASRDLEKTQAANKLKAERFELQKRIAEAPVDEWTAGTFKTEARFVSATGETVTLQKTDGVEVTVAIDKLDDASQRKVQQRKSERTRWNARVDQIGRLLSN